MVLHGLGQRLQGVVEEVLDELWVRDEAVGLVVAGGDNPALLEDLRHPVEPPQASEDQERVVQVQAVLTPRHLEAAALEGTGKKKNVRKISETETMELVPSYLTSLSSCTVGYAMVTRRDKSDGSEG